MTYMMSSLDMNFCHVHNNLMFYQYMGDNSRSFSCTYKKRERRSELKIYHNIMIDH
jgi:hypothetical protein